MLVFNLHQSEEIVLKMPRWVANKRMKQLEKVNKDIGEN